MMDRKGAWKLSSAYDVTLSYHSTTPFGNCHKMKINGKQKDFVPDDFLEVARNMEINHPGEIIGHVHDAIRRWPSFAKKAGVKKTVATAVESLQYSLDI